MQSSTSTFLTAPGSGRTAAIAALLLIGATAGALSTFVLQKASGLKKRATQLQSLLHPDLPASTLDVASLSRLELGSDSVRALFFLAFRSPTLPIGGTFTNHGSYGTVPRPVMQYFHNMLERVEANPDLWFRMHSWIMTRKAIVPFAELVHCDPECLVFVNNATTAVNAVLHSVPLAAGDVLLTFDCTYNACKIAMKNIAQLRGAEYVEISLPLPLRDEQQVLDAFSTQLDLLASAGKRVRFALVDAITSPTAIVLPWRELCRLAKARGVPCMVDGAHALGQIDIDLSAGDVDWFTTNIHKWSWGPKGTALLYAHPSRQASLHPLVASHNHAAGFTKSFHMQATREDTAYIAAAESLNFAKALGVQRCKDYTQSLADWAESMGTEKIQASIPSKKEATTNDVAVSSSSSSSTPALALSLCPASMRAPNMRLIRLPWRVPSDEAARGPLADRLGLILCSQFALVLPIIYEPHTQAFWLRFSTQIYNRQEDYERMIACVLAFAQLPEQKQLLE